MEDIPNSILSTEYFNNLLYKGHNHILNFTALLAFFGGRHVISDFYEHRQDLLCNPIIKILILFSILYMNIKDVKISILIFFIYIFFIDNYIEDKCNSEFYSNEQPKEVKKVI
jgi:hypothetical protein